MRVLCIHLSLGECVAVENSAANNFRFVCVCVCFTENRKRFDVHTSNVVVEKCKINSESENKNTNKEKRSVVRCMCLFEIPTFYFALCA